MIIGSCPYRDCEFIHLIPFSGPDRFTQEECEECGRPFWLRHSRLDPQAYTPEEFEAEFKIDPRQNIVIARTPEQPAPDPDQQTINAARRKLFFDFLIDRIMYGSGDPNPMGILSVMKNE